MGYGRWICSTKGFQGWNSTKCFQDWNFLCWSQISHSDTSMEEDSQGQGHSFKIKGSKNMPVHTYTSWVMYTPNLETVALVPWTQQMSHNFGGQVDSRMDRQTDTPMGTHHYSGALIIWDYHIMLNRRTLREGKSYWAENMWMMGTRRGRRAHTWCSQPMMPQPLQMLHNTPIHTLLSSQHVETIYLVGLCHIPMIQVIPSGSRTERCVSIKACGSNQHYTVLWEIATTGFLSSPRYYRIWTEFTWIIQIRVFTNIGVSCIILYTVLHP